MILVCIREAFGVDPRDADHKYLKFAPNGAERRLRLDYVCINNFVVNVLIVTMPVNGNVTLLWCRRLTDKSNVNAASSHHSL